MGIGAILAGPRPLAPRPRFGGLGITSRLGVPRHPCADLRESARRVRSEHSIPSRRHLPERPMGRRCSWPWMRSGARWRKVESKWPCRRPRAPRSPATAVVRTTSIDPSRLSRTSHPAALSSPRIRSASAKFRAALASLRRTAQPMAQVRWAASSAPAGGVSAAPARPLRATSTAVPTFTDCTAEVTPSTPSARRHAASARGPAALARVERGVAGRGEGEHRRHGARGIEVVVERLGQLALEPLGRLDERRRRRPSGRRQQAVLELAQPPRPLARAGQRLVGEVELLPVVDLEHQQAHGARIHAVLPQVPRGRDVAESLGHLGRRGYSGTRRAARSGRTPPARCRRSSARSRPRGAGRSGPPRRRGCPARRCPGGGGSAPAPWPSTRCASPGRPRPNGRVPRRAHRLVLRLGRLPQDEVARVLLAVLVRADPLARARL